MKISMGFYDVVANLIPVLLIALAVERFGATPDPEDRPSQFTTGLGAIASLTMAEAVTLAVVAHGASNRLADGTVVVALTFGWMLLVMTYATAMLEEFSRDERGHTRRRRANLALLAIAVFCPTAFMTAYIVTLFV